MPAVTRQEVVDQMMLNYLDNVPENVSPADAREIFTMVLDYIDTSIALGVPVDFDTIYRKVADSYTKTEVDNLLQGISLTPGPQGLQGPQGIQGNSPYIDATTGNWFIAGVDLGVSASGSPGATGPAGNSPYIDATTGNWFVGGVDTGVTAQGPAGADGGNYTINSNGNWVAPDGTDTGIRAAAGTKVDYNIDIVGSRDGVNQVFSASEDYVPGSVKVWHDGMLLNKGNGADFTESTTNNRDVVIDRIVTSDNWLVFEYERKSIV